MSPLECQLCFSHGEIARAPFGHLAQCKSQSSRREEGWERCWREVLWRRKSDLQKGWFEDFSASGSLVQMELADDYQINNKSSGILHRHGQHFPCNSEELHFTVKQNFFISFSCLPSFSLSFHVSVKLVFCKLPIFLLASRADASGEGGGRAHCGVQTSMTPQELWVTPILWWGFPWPSAPPKTAFPEVAVQEQQTEPESMNKKISLTRNSPPSPTRQVSAWRIYSVPQYFFFIQADHQVQRSLEGCFVSWAGNLQHGQTSTSLWHKLSDLIQWYIHRFKGRAGLQMRGEVKK